MTMKQNGAAEKSKVHANARTKFAIANYCTVNRNDIESGVLKVDDIETNLRRDVKEAFNRGHIIRTLKDFGIKYAKAAPVARKYQKHHAIIEMIGIVAKELASFQRKIGESSETTELSLIAVNPHSWAENKYRQMNRRNEG
jgi:hypothetical protein